MKATHSEDLEFLRKIRGCFGSRQMWLVEYEFTGEEIIERHGGRIKNQIRISDIIETDISFASKELKLKTNSSKMNIQVLPSLNKVIMKEAEEANAKMSEGERQHFEEVKRKIVLRFKLMNLIGAVIVCMAMIGLVLLIAWLMRKH